MQQWRWVGNRLQNVGSGEFLHADTMYICVSKRTKFWEGTITVVETRPGDGIHASAQNWAVETYEPYGEVLWHQSDGRMFIVDWNTFKEGQGMLVWAANRTMSSAGLVLQGDLTDRLTS